MPWRHFSRVLCIFFSFPKNGERSYCLLTKSHLTLLGPHGLQLLRPWDVPGKNTGVGYHFLLQGSFSTQRSNPSLLRWQADSLPVSHQGSLERKEYLLISPYPPPETSERILRNSDRKKKKETETGIRQWPKWLGLHTSTVGDAGSISGQGTKIPHAVWCSQKRKTTQFDLCAQQFVPPGRI